MAKLSKSNIANYLTPEILETLNRFNEISLNDLSKKYYNQISGVYFLYDNDDTLIYIGQSSNINRRLVSHANKNFSYYKYVEINNEKDRLIAERIFLNKHLPALNKDSVTTKIKSNEI